MSTALICAPVRLLGKNILSENYWEAAALGTHILPLITEFEVKVAIKEFYPKGILVRTEDRKTLISVESEKDNFKYGLNRFIKEAEILEKFKKASTIVAVEDVFQENGTAYMVMEYLEGMTLEEKLKSSDTPMSEKEVVQVIYPLLNTLAKVHEEGLIHRDISPDNIYIRDNGQIKLLDFGSARYSLGQQSKNLSVLLKHGYAPPEQYATKGRQGPWTDIYAVAATMYTMLTKKQLLSSLDYSMGEKMQPLRELNQNVSEAFESIVQKGLSLGYKDRYQDVSEMLEELGAVTGIPYRVSKMKAERSENRTVKEICSKGTQGAQDVAVKDTQQQETTGWTHQGTVAFEEDPKDIQKNKQYQNVDATKRNRKGKKGWFIAAAIISLLLIVYFASPYSKYFKARRYLNEGEYQTAVSVFENLDGFLDSGDQIEAAVERVYSDGSVYYNDDSYEQAYMCFKYAANYGYVKAQYMMGYMLETWTWR